MLNTRIATTAKRVPSAAVAANVGPCSNVMVSKIGPETMGNADSHPATPGPHFRPTRVTENIKLGTKKSLRSRIEVIYGDVFELLLRREFRVIGLSKEGLTGEAATKLGNLQLVNQGQHIVPV